MGGFLYEFAQDNVTAKAGGGASSATQLTAQTSRVTVVATSGDSIKLPASAPGLELLVINHGANAMQVFGAGTDTINDVSAATGVSQMQLSTTIYTCTTAGAWYTEGLASGFLNGLPTVSANGNVTAFAGGGQASATLLGNVINRIVTVATAGDSVRLPLAGAGLQITIANSSANSLNVFPAVGDTINALGANAALALASGKTATIYSAVPTFWHAIVSA